MELGLEKYNDYIVKAVQQIKGNYGFRVVLKYEDGRRKTQQLAGFSTIQEAQDMYDLVKVQLKQRKYLVYGNVLFKEFATHWLEDEIRANANSYNTYYSYQSIMKNHIIPVLGNKRMKAINSADIYCLYKKLYGYSASVADQARTILNTCLECALNEKAVEVNMAKDIRLHKKEKSDISEYHTRKIEKTLSYEQVLKLIEGSKGNKIHIMILFNAVMGLRCSEIIGLKYSDVDFIKQELHISRQLGRDIKKKDAELNPKTRTKQEIGLKTMSSKRVIKIPDIVFDAILQQRKWYEKCRSRRSKTFQDLGYICCSTYGRPRSKNFHYEEFKKLLKELDLPDISWHGLRATCATQLLLQGVSPKAIAANHGHAKEIVTVNNYIDNSKITTEVLDRLDVYIESLLPSEKTEDAEAVDLSGIILDIEEYFPDETDQSGPDAVMDKTGVL